MKRNGTQQTYGATVQLYTKQQHRWITVSSHLVEAHRARRDERDEPAHEREHDRGHVRTPRARGADQERRRVRGASGGEQPGAAERAWRIHTEEWFTHAAHSS